MTAPDVTTSEPREPVMPVEASVLAAADWSVRPEKRVVAIARSVGDGRHRLEHVEPAGEPGSLVDRLLRLAPAGRGVLLGLDLPIGLPAAYSARAGITSFREAVRRFGSGAWSEFYEISDRPTIHRPFYPPPSRIAGERRRAVLLDGLHCGRPEELLRACDRARPGRTAAESVFWTLGGRQVGRSAIHAWPRLIAPLGRRGGLWPFDGELAPLVAARRLTVAEVYPAEAAAQLGVRAGAGSGRSKARPDDRRAMLAEGFAAVSGRRLTVRPALRRRLLGRDPGEDAVDAILALLAMVEVAAGRRSAGAPRRPIVRRIEGWILGLDGDPDGVPDPGPDDDPNAGPWRDPSAGRRPVPEAISSPAARR